MSYLAEMTLIDESERSTVTHDSVSVVIPCFNEEQFIGTVLQNLAGQYQRGEYEIIVVDGQSTDATRSVIGGFATANPGLRISVVDNPARYIPVALNLGINAARGEFIIRMDAHSVPSSNYVSRCVQLLKDEQASVVGMSWHIKPGDTSTVARAIAMAVAHPFGVGDARYRLATTTAQFVDTVPFGAFRKTLWQKVGGFNEDLLANEDYDFNYRVRQSGGKVLLDSQAHCDYFARPTISQLARQYWRYGSWKAQMLRLHPSSVKLRQVVAPLFVAWLLLSFALGFFWGIAWWLLAATIALYAVGALISSLQLSLRRRDMRSLFVLPFIFFTIHWMWGSGFLFGLIRRPR
jgi:succinoglycan biosynthesis protein ExoA